MGNILSLDRKGHLGASFGDMDKLMYDYNDGNKLQKVTDTGNNTYGFKDGTNTDNDYQYDANGSMIVDQNKGISSITYNRFNLPTTVSISNTQGTGNISYIYDATGAKLKKTAPSGGSLIETEYAGNYIYKNGNLEFFNHPEGIVEKEADGYKYVYQFKDHLGNVRLSYKDANKDGSITQDEIVQEKNYYPFGLEHRGYNNILRGAENKHFTYVGKELNESLDYNMLEMDWRHYDPTTARFVTIDAMAESFEDYTPYHYSNNSPIMYKDPTGLFTDVVNEETGETYHVDDGYDFEFTVSADDFAEISESGAIPGRLKWAWQKEFWSQVWQELTTSDGSISDDVTQFMITDEVEDGIEAIDQVSNGQYLTAGLTLFLRKVQKAKKGYKLVKKLFKHGKKGKMPTPDLNPDQFKKVGDTRVHIKTGAIFKKSHTSHGNVGNTGDQWKAWSKGTTDFGNTSKKTGARVTIDGDGNVIGN